MIRTKNLKNSLTFGFNNSLPKNLHKEIIHDVHKNIYEWCTQKFAQGYCRVIYNRKKGSNLNCRTAGEWLSKVYVNIMEYYTGH